MRIAIAICFIAYSAVLVGLYQHNLPHWCITDPVVVELGLCK